MSVNESCGIRVEPRSRCEVILDLAGGIRFYDENREEVLAHGESARAHVRAHSDCTLQGETIDPFHPRAPAPPPTPRHALPHPRAPPLRTLLARGVWVTFDCRFPRALHFPSRTTRSHPRMTTTWRKCP